MIKIKGYPDLRKSNGSIVNVNSSEYRTALKRRQNINKVEELDKEVKALGAKLDSILEILHEVRSHS